MSLRHRLIPAICASVFVMAGCGGGGGGGASSTSSPVANATASVAQGQAPLAVNFDGSKSSDPQGLALTFTWTFGDGATASGASVSHTYQNHGSYTARVAVADGHARTDSTPLNITVTAAPPTVQPASLPVNVLGVAQTSVNGQIGATDRENLTLSYALATSPTKGNATVDSNTGAITYTVPGFVTASSDSFTVKVSNAAASATATVSVVFNADPLLPNQWHLQNTGQHAFATILPVAGNDMNVAGAWTAGYTGKGIKVAVVDTGLEAAHEDLAANVDLSHSFDFASGGSDPSPVTPGEDHGTQVAGIIGAIAFNGKGGRGVAYNATLRGYNLLSAGSGDTLANLAIALGGGPVSADNDVFNASFGETGGQAPFDFLGPTLPTFDPAKGNINANTATLRNTLGAALVQAAGNDFRAWSNARSSTATACAAANQYGVSCGDPASDTRRASSYPIIVGALNAKGTRSSYSSSGSSLWISAPGGEYGWDASLTAGVTPFPDTAAFVTQPAIVTTAHTGCAGYTTTFNTLDDMGGNVLAAKCQYTATMNGTSAATPNTVGVVALMLEANPILSVRDIKYILANTARHVDPSFAGVSSSNILPGTSFVLEQGWVTNAAGYKFSNWYGFGGIDAAAAVTMARSYTTYLPALQIPAGYVFSPTQAVTIAAQSHFDINIAASEAFTVVEGAIVYISFASTPGMLCNQVELTSPAGTKSILMHGANGFGNVSVANARLESNAFYGEPVNGHWVLRIWDLCAASQTHTVLPANVAQNILFVGH